MKHMPGSRFRKKPVITSLPIHPPKVAPVLLGRPPLAMMGQSIESFIGLLARAGSRSRPSDWGAVEDMPADNGINAHRQLTRWPRGLGDCGAKGATKASEALRENANVPADIHPCTDLEETSHYRGLRPTQRTKTNRRRAWCTMCSTPSARDHRSNCTPHAAHRARYGITTYKLATQTRT